MKLVPATEAKKEYFRKYYQAHKDYYKKRNAQWWKDHPEKARAKWRRKYWKDPEKSRAKRQQMLEL